MIWGDNELTQIKDGAIDGEQLIVKIYRTDSHIFQNIKIKTLKDLTTNNIINYFTYQSNGILLASAEVDIAYVNEENSELSISPQPVTNNVFINFNGSLNGEATAEIYDILSNIVGTYNFDSVINATNSIRLDLSNLSSGMYNLVIKSGSIVYKTKLIKVAE